MARKELFIDVFETDTFNQWRLKTNSIKINLQDIYDELDALGTKFVSLTGNQEINGVKSFIQKSNWTKEYTQNQITPLLELKITNSNATTTSTGKGSGASIDFYNSTTAVSQNTQLVSRIASVNENDNDTYASSSLVFSTCFTFGKTDPKPEEAMRIDSTGRVGIGTTEPVGTLNIRKDNSDCLLIIQSKEDNFSAVQFGDDKSGRSGQIQYHNTDNSMHFFTESTGTSSERLRITSVGKVGIGITNPIEKLEVAGNIKSVAGAGLVQLNASDGSIEISRNITDDNGPFIDFKDTSSDDFDCRIGQNSSNGLFFSTGGNDETNRRIIINGTGEVGIGKVASIGVALDVAGKTNITGRLGVSNVENPDYDLCVGARSDEAGHVFLSGREGIIGLRSLANTSHGWMFNSSNAAAGDLVVTSRKLNTTTNEYDDTNLVRFKSNNSVLITKKLGITSLGSNAEGTPTTAKLVVKSSADDTVSGQFRGAIQVNQFDVANRAYGFLSTNRGSAMVGGNLRLTNPSNSNIGKEAKVYIVVDNEYVLYHNSNVIGSGSDWRQAGIHTFKITGNDRLGITAQNTGGPFGLAFVVTLVETGEILLTSNSRDTAAVVNLPGTFSPRWNVDFNLFNVDDNTPQPGTFANVLRILREAIPGGDSGSAENIWKAGYLEDRNIFFQGRVEDITQAFVKGTNDRGSSGIQFIQGSASTGQIAFLRATDNNNNDYFVNESARFDENGRLGIGTTEPKQMLDVAGSIRSSGPYLFLQNDGYPQLVLSNADGQTKRFGIWKSGSSLDRMTIGPQATDGAGVGAIFVNRNATIEIPKGGKVNTIIEDDNALINKGYVDTVISDLDTKLGGAVSDTFQASGAITIGTTPSGTRGIARLANSMFTAPTLSHLDKGIIPAEGTGHYSHGTNFAALIAASDKSDSGGLFIDVADNNNDEHALSIYNTSTAIDKEVFHIRSSTGDTYSAGDIYARGGIASETAVALGNENSYFILEKNNNTLKLGFKSENSQNALSISSLGKVSLEKEPTADKHAATKGYVDKTLNASVITTLPKFASTTGDFLNYSNATYAKNTEFSFTIGDICNLSTAELARVYAVDATVHQFGSNAHEHVTSYKYPDGEFREVQGSKGFNSDDDCGSSAQILLPVSGSKVTFKSNQPGRSEKNSQQQVVINGFWYYDVDSTPGLTTTSFPGLDQFDIDMLVLNNLGSRYAIYNSIWDSYLKTGVEHDVLIEQFVRPSYTADSEWADFDERLLPTSGDPEFGILVTAPGVEEGVQGMPNTTIDKIKEYVIRGGTLFIFSENMNVTRHTDHRIESLIQELGGIVPAIGQQPTDPPVLNVRNIHTKWLYQASGTTKSFRTTDEAVNLGIVHPNVSLRGVATGGIIESQSNGVSLIKGGGIHMWDNQTKSGSLSDNVNGKIVWFGDWNFPSLKSIMQTLLTHIEKN